MSEQIGPRQFLRQLQAQAPYYARMLPELPRLLHDYLQQQHADDGAATRAELMELIREQRRANRILGAVAAAGAGFLIGLIIMQLVIWIGIHLR